METDKLAAGAVATGWALFGVSLSDLLLVVQIFAGLAAAIASVAAAVYYIRKSK
jgi:hypothetical protein